MHTDRHREHYTQCDDERDPQWMRCTLCGRKIYVSEVKPLDKHRHERDCPFR